MEKKHQLDLPEDSPILWGIRENLVLRISVVLLHFVLESGQVMAIPDLMRKYPCGKSKQTAAEAAR